MVSRPGELRFAMIGAGFWARYQIAAWKEIPGVRLMALCDLDERKAEDLATEFGIPAVYRSAEEMLAGEQLDFVDIATSPESHPLLTAMAVQRRVPVICQKPMALDYQACRDMVRLCEETTVPLLIHENFRWQAPMRKVKELLLQSAIGAPFRAHIQFSHGDLSFFDRQPFLYRQQHFALFDMGPHVLDLARFFLGEPDSLYARELSVHPRFAGGDIVWIMLHFEAAQCHIEMSWSAVPYEVFIEGPLGTITSYPDGRVSLQTASRVTTETLTPRCYDWADLSYGFVHASIVDTNRQLAAVLRGECLPETPGKDNLKTMWLLNQVLESASSNRVVVV